MLAFTAEQLRYCASHIGKSLLWTAADFVTIYALVTIGAHDPSGAGLLFLIGMGANACADVAVGYWLDRSPRHECRMAAAGLLVAAMAFPLTMLTTSSGPGALLVATLVFRIAYSAYDVPHNALLSKLAPARSIAMRMSRLRTLGTGIAAGLVGVGLHQASGRDGLIVLLLSVSVAALMLGSALLPLLRTGRATVACAERAESDASFALPLAFFIASIAGIVGLGMLAKAMFHMPDAAASTDAGGMLILLTGGRTLAALLPLQPASGRTGMRSLAGTYALAGLAIIPVVAYPGGTGGLLMLGLAMGATNLIAWATLPFVIRKASGYGIYTMCIKVALGASGLLMTAWLGSEAAFTSAGFVRLSLMSAAACGAAALLLAWSVTIARTGRHRRPAAAGIDTR